MSLIIEPTTQSRGCKKVNIQNANQFGHVKEKKIEIYVISQKGQLYRVQTHKYMNNARLKFS